MTELPQICFTYYIDDYVIHAIDEKYSMSEDLNQSTSIKDAFVIKGLDIPEYFEKVSFGVGSKYIYTQEQFVKEHYDTKLPPNEEGLPHIMTLVITNCLRHLRICGKELEDYSNNAVFFTLNCPHEAVPWNDYDQPRISYVFPVYGIYTGLTSFGEILEPTTAFDAILGMLDECLTEQYPNYNHLHGCMKAIKNGNAIYLAKILCKTYIDYDQNSYQNEYQYDLEQDPCDIPVYYKISYTDENGEEKVYVSSGITSVVNCTNLIVTPLPMTHSIIFKLKEIVQYEKIQMINKYKSFIDTTVDPIPDSVTIPFQSFILRLSGRYLPTSTVDSLIPQDKVLYDYISKTRRVTFQPCIGHVYNRIYVFNGKRFEQYSYNEDVDDEFETLALSNLQAIFDERCSYDPRYSRVNAFLIIN